MPNDHLNPTILRALGGIMRSPAANDQSLRTFKQAFGFWDTEFVDEGGVANVFTQVCVDAGTLPPDYDEDSGNHYGG